MENQNPTQPVSEVVQTVPPVILSSPASPNGGTGNPSPIDPKPTKKFPLKLVIGIIIFLLLAGGAAAGYSNKDKLVSLVATPTSSPTVIPDLIRDPSPTTDPTADWKTYEMEGLSFKYPTNMEAFPCGMKGVDQIVSVGIKKIGDKTTYCGIGGIPAIFTIGTDGENKTINEYLTRLRLNSNQASNLVIYKEIGGYKIGLTTLNTAGGYSTQSHALVNPINNVLYYIHSDQNWNVNGLLLDQILSTFKFTQNNNEDISFKLPSDWQVLKNSAEEIQIAQNNGATSLTFTKYQNQNLNEMIQLAKNGIVMNLNSKKHIIDDVEATEYSGCLNPEVCNRVTNIVLPVKDAYYIVHAPDIDPILLDQILSGIQILKKTNN